MTSPHGHVMPDTSAFSFLTPLQTSLGIVPEGNLHLLPDSAPSLFWHDVTGRDSARFTWRNALLGRSANAPVSFQAELFKSGDFIFRYDLGTNNTLPERFIIGAQANHGGETALASLPDSACSSNGHVCSTIWRMDGTNVTSTPLCVALGDAPRFELRWSALGDITGEDTDSDGVSDAHEILLHHTDPHLADTDGDGLSDGSEITAGLNPLDPDEDGDGIPDGLDPAPLAWNDAEEDLDGDGYGLLFELLHDLDPSVYDLVDSDGDGWGDWQEALAGTSPTDITESPGNPDGFPKIFSVTLSVLEAPEANVSVSIGDKTFVIPAEAGGDTQAMSMGMNIASTGGDIALWFKEGVAHDVSLFASADCRMRLGVSLGSSCAAFQNPHKVFTTGGELRGGARTASGMIAQPALSTSPEPPICFHTTEDMQVTSHVLPKGIKGTWSNYLYPVWSSGIGNSRSVSYFDTFDSASFEFHADEAPQSRYVSVDITRCALLDDNPGPPGSHDPEEPCECCSGGNPECGCSCHPSTGEPILYDNNDNGGGGMLVSINNDDDDASETEDRGDTALELADNDLVSYYPLGKYDGTCCPCPEHAANGVASSATLVSDSSNLRLWLDASKSNAFSGTINAGEAIYIEGLAKSSAVNGEELVWQYTKDGETHCFTNAFTILSQRIFADLDFDGDVDETDMALHPALSPEHGWVMPVNTNAFRKIQLRTDVGLPGTYTLRLSGSGVRVWQSPHPATGDTPLLVAGQTVTNGIGSVSWSTSSTDTVYIEAFTNGTSILTYAFIGTGTASGIVSRASLKMTAVEIDLDGDTDRDGDIDDDDDTDETGHTLSRGILVTPPLRQLAFNGANDVSGLSKITIASNPAVSIPGMSLRLRKTYEPSGCTLFFLNSDGEKLPDIGVGNGYYDLPGWPSETKTMYVMPQYARPLSAFSAPIRFDLVLEAVDASGNVQASDGISLKVAPMILPPECNAAQSVYTTAIDGIPGAASVGADDAYAWAQDMVKFVKYQIAEGQVGDMFVDLEHRDKGSFPDKLRTVSGFDGTKVWAVEMGGEGGNIMATPPLPDAPFGKLLIGSAKDNFQDPLPYWRSQGVQPTVRIDTSAIVGH